MQAEIATHLEAAHDDAERGVFAENVEAVTAFIVVASQWRAVAGMGALVFLGLDYQGVQAGLDAAGIELTPDLFAALQVMEGAACEALNARNGANA